MYWVVLAVHTLKSIRRDLYKSAEGNAYDTTALYKAAFVTHNVRMLITRQEL